MLKSKPDLRRSRGHPALAERDPYSCYSLYGLPGRQRHRRRQQSGVLAHPSSGRASRPVPHSVSTRLVVAFRSETSPRRGGARLAGECRALVHLLFYIVILGMIASGIGMIVKSGAIPAIFAAPTPALPNFTAYPPRAPHGLGAFLLVVLLTFHVATALYHEFIRNDGLFRRMWYEA